VQYHWFVIARVLHVLAIVVWIGGIGAVTTVMFPVMRRLDSNQQRVWMFDQIERSFRPQARIAWVVVGLTGLYMLASLGVWARFIEPHYWWMHAMVGLWLLFGLLLFAIEPLVVGPRIRRSLACKPQQTIVPMRTLHAGLLVLSLLVIAAVVGGTYGLF
jgi:uncharacterized membrane protein